MSRSLTSLLLSCLLFAVATAQLTYQNNVQLLYPPTTIPINGSITVTVQWETNYNGPVNLHFDLSDLSRNYSYYGGSMVVVQGPGSGDAILTAVSTANMNLGDQFQLHAYLTPTNYSSANGVGNDWMYAWANTYPIAVVTNGVTLNNYMTLLYPPATIPTSGYVAFDVAYTSNLPWYTMLHIDLSDITANWAWEGGSYINVTSPGSGVVQFNISIQNGGQPLKIGDTYDINMYMTSAAINQQFGTANDWMNRNFSTTATTVTVAPATSFWNNVALVNPPSTIPTSGAFTLQASYSTNFSGQVILHCDLSDVNNSYAYDGGYSMVVTGPGTGLVTMTINISAQVSTALNTSHAFNLHTYLLNEAASQATGVYNDWKSALGNNNYPVVASNSYSTAVYDDYIQLLNPPVSIPNSGVVFLTVEWESSAVGTVDLRIDLSDASQSYAWGGGASVTMPSPGSGITTLQFNLVNGTAGTLNQLDVWQFHVYTLSAANLTAYPNNYWNYANAQQYYPVVVSNTPITNYAYIVNPPTIIPQTGTFTVDLYYISNLANQTVINLDINDLSLNWKWFTGTSVTVNSPSAGTVRLTLNLPASLGLIVGDNLVLQYYLTSIWNSTNNPGNNWQNFQFEDRSYVQVAPVGQFINSLTPINAPAQVPNTGNFTIMYQYSTNVTGLVNLHCDISDVTASWKYDGGETAIQVEGPSQGTVVFTVNIQYAAVTSDQIVLHAYMTPNTFTLANGGTSLDWTGTVTDTFTYVQAVVAANLAPFAYSDNLFFLNAPTTIPTTGTVDFVLLYSSSAAVSTVLHCDLQDITKSYAWDGGYTMVVPSPGSGSVTCSIPITSVLAAGDQYQVHAYSVSAANHTAHAANEWQWTNYDVYTPVMVSNTPLTNFVQLLNAPTTIPTVGTVTYELQYTSNFGNQTVLHLDLNDVTQSWKWYTGATAIVQSPGSGTVQVTLTFTAAMALTVGDSFSLKAYMTSIANDTAHPGDDWQYSGYDQYNTVSVAAPGTFINSLSPLYAPIAIPSTGLFSTSYQYSTNITGLVDLHLDISTLAWAYVAGSPTMQVSGPGQGTMTFTINVTSYTNMPLTVGQSYYLHAYMAATSAGLEYGVGNDWMPGNDRGDSIITVPAATAQTVNSQTLPYSITFYQNPGTIPTSGTVEYVMEWSSPAPTASNLHIDLSDVSNNYAWGGGASVTVPSPGRGFKTLQIPLVGNLNPGDVWQAHAYITTIANATAYPGLDWQHSSYDLYVPVVVSAAPLTNYMSIINPPTTISTVGTVSVEVFYISSCANYTNLHMDLSDVTQSWLYEAGSMVTVPSPGTGTVMMTISTTAANNMKVGDNFDLHLYFTCAANATVGGGLDWNNTNFNSVALSVQAALPGTFINSLTPVSAPFYIPSSGNFTIQYAWSCNITGTMNFHVDLSDLTYNWLYEGGATVQATCPGMGVAPFNIQLSNGNISSGDSYKLHAYMAPATYGLIYGTSNDWQHSLWDGFTTVQAQASGSSGVTNSLTFVNPVAIIPQSGSFYVTLAYTSNLATMSNIHIDLSDVTQSWKFIVGSLTQVTSPGSGQISVMLTVPASAPLVVGDLFELHAYMASIANATTYGNSTDWQHSAVDATTVVTAISGPLTNQMTVLNAPTTIATTGMETFQLIWSSPTADLLNLHCDLSDITMSYAYDGGSYIQVQGPGSGLVNMPVVLANSVGGGALTLGDQYTLHCYMTNNTETVLLGGTSNDWKAPQSQSFYPMTVAAASSFTTMMNVLQLPSGVPTCGNFSVQVAWSSNVQGDVNLHLDLSDASSSFSYDGGAMQVVASPGSGIVTMNILIASTMPLRDQYVLHAYMAPSANSTGWGGTGNDWKYAIFNQQWNVSALSNAVSGCPAASSTGSAGPSTTSSTGSVARRSSSTGSVVINNGGSSSSSGLSGGAIAGIVIGSVVGASILAAILCLFLCGAGRGGKGGKLDDGHVTGGHKRHEDEPSTAQSAVEMGETHSMDDEAMAEEA